jgi:hypothetical protein
MQRTKKQLQRELLAALEGMDFDGLVLGSFDPDLTDRLARADDDINVYSSPSPEALPNYDDEPKLIDERPPTREEFFDSVEGAIDDWAEEISHAIKAEISRRLQAVASEIREQIDPPEEEEMHRETGYDA